MRFLGNILWHVPFLGFISAFFTFLTGVFFLVTVIGAPIGIGLMQHSRFLLAPFSHSMVSKKELRKDQNQLWKSFGIIAQIIYFPVGLLLAALTLIQIAALFTSIAGIPVAIVLAKSLGTFFNPVGKICVPKAVADELNQRKAKVQVDKYLSKS